MEHNHHSARQPSGAPAVPTATEQQQSSQPAPSYASSLASLAAAAHKHQHCRPSSPLIAAVAAAVSDFSHISYESDSDPADDMISAAHSPASSSPGPSTTSCPSSSTSVSSSPSSPAPSVLSDLSNKNKRAYAIPSTMAKRPKLDIDQTSASELSPASASSSTYSSSTSNTTEVKSTGSTGSHSSPSTLPPTAYRRMRSKSLPDVSLLSLHSSLSSDWPSKKRSPQSRQHRQHRHYHHPAVASPVAATLNVPPVNLQGLRELDLQEIFKNPQLRHDIVFDPQLQFRPNLDGERGMRKKALADKYWDGVVLECDALKAVYASGRLPAVIDRNSKLVGIVTSLREILISLLPARDRAQLEEVLDLDLQFQQLQHGAFDFAKLAKWLVGVFKSHCAPMRDTWVDQMLALVISGVEHNDSRKLVDGLRMVFTILEAMKLDVANHQIRTLRPLLVETAVEFEQENFANRVARRKVDVKEAVDWYKTMYEKSKKRGTSLTGGDKRAVYLDSFVSGLVGLFGSSAGELNLKSEFPVTFAFDYSRLRSLKSDVAQITSLQQCLMLYRQLLASCAPGAAPSQQEMDTLKAELLILVSEDASLDPSVAPTAELGSGTIGGVSFFSTNTRWTTNSASIALQIARKVKDRFPTRGGSLTALTDIASNWLVQHLGAGQVSTIHKLVEGRLMGDLEKRVKACFAAAVTTVGSNGNTAAAAASSEQQWSLACRDVAQELSIIASRICLLGDYHWSVFSGYYISAVMN
ncbi:T-complex protein 11-domain-containing protein [Lipomyces oligophaga]|uniref:T-complex protein 11-domain-containing protein n=1 Tax=Lipomyces oligophaga TaxID=45792 RepID=UPI0034CEE127